MDDLQGQILVAAVAVAGAAAILHLRSKRTKNKKDAFVSELFVYPIKSCAEESVSSARVTSSGFENDRVAQVTDAHGKYCTPRDPDKSNLFHVRPSLKGAILKLEAPRADEAFTLDLASAPTEAVSAEAMDSPGTALRDYGQPVADWLQRATGIKGCRLTGIGEGYGRTVKINPDQGDTIPPAEDPAPVSLADEAPFLLTNTTSLDDLNRRLSKRGKGEIDVRRFRPNIVARGLRPWEEDTWRRIRIGGAEFHVWQRCGRCTMTTIDRDDLKRGPEPLATLSTFRERKNGQRNFGMHLIPVTPEAGQGDVKVGDLIEVLEYDEERKAEWHTLFG